MALLQLPGTKVWNKPLPQIDQMPRMHKLPQLLFERCTFGHGTNEVGETLRAPLQEATNTGKAQALQKKQDSGQKNSQQS